jgi:hypothetical protein
MIMQGGMDGKAELGEKLFQYISDEEEQKLANGAGQGLFPWVCLALMLVIPGCFLSRQDQSSGDKPASQLTATFTAETSLTSSPPIKILDAQLKVDKWFACVEGNTENASSKILSYAKVGACLYDAVGRRIGEYLDNIVDLWLGAIWRFRGHCRGDKAYPPRNTAASQAKG